MIILFIITAIFIAWIWMDYYRLIDIYEFEELKYFILIFFLGALSTQVTLEINRVFLDGFDLKMDGNILNDLLYCIFKIGMVEEFSKLLPLGIMLLFFKKQINEPIDFISYLCVSALGFSAAENVMYFSSYGSEIISGRSILSSLGHMIFASFTAYGIILYKYKKVKIGWPIILIYFFIGSISHGIYDFWLMHYHSRIWGYFVTVLFFLESVSLFAVMLNNALNNSEFFTYKKVVNSDRVGNRLLLYYFIVFILQFSLISIESNIGYAIGKLGFQTFFVGFIVFICSIRLSRYKLIKGRWFPLKLELPFYYKKIQLYKNSEATKRLSIRGEAYNEVFLNKYYQEYLWLNPLSSRNSFLKTSKVAYIEKKIFLFNDESYYVTKLYLDDTNTRYEYVLLKPKLNGKRFTSKKSPIVAVLRTKDMMHLSDINLKVENFEFIEWAYPKSFEEWKKTA